MFSCQSPYCNNEYITCNHTEFLGGGWGGCSPHTGTIIFSLIQLYSLWGSTLGRNDGVETEKSKLIWTHHVADNEAFSTAIDDLRVDDLRSFQIICGFSLVK